MHGTQVLVQYNHSLVQVFIKKKNSMFLKFKAEIFGLEFHGFYYWTETINFWNFCKNIFEKFKFQKGVKIVRNEL